MKIALVHDWLTGMRGGEKCLEILCELLPQATVFALLHNPGSVSRTIERREIRTSFVQGLPGASHGYRWYLPLFPVAVEQLDLAGFDLVISVSHCAAKGVKCPPGAFHLCYCLTPMRYVWEMYPEYFGPGRLNPLLRPLVALIAGRLRAWDVASSERVDRFVAISQTVADRIRNHYGREAKVVYPPVDTEFFHPGPQIPQRGPGNDPFFLIVSALVPYKRIELGIKCFNQLGKRLTIVGTGPEEKRLRRIARSNIEFVGWASADSLREYYRTCAALIFPGIEDFGIVPLEAQACGTPVIAYRAGGAVETVIEGETGVFFDEQTSRALGAAVQAFSTCRFDWEQIRAQALRFDRETFRDRMRSVIEGIRAERQRPSGGGLQ